MNETKRLLRQLRKEYAVAWAMAVIVYGLLRLEVLPSGWLTGNDMAAYLMQLICIILTFGSVALAFRLFPWKKKHLQELSLAEALRSYHLLCRIRFMMLGAALLCDELLFFGAIDASGVYLAAIAAISLLAIVPTQGHVTRTLDLSADEDA